MKAFALGAVVFLVALTPATLVTTSVGEKREPAPRQESTITIQIVADADSVIAVPAVVTVRPGQRVEWVCDLGEWEVKFKNGEPFGEGSVRDGIKGGRGNKHGRNVRAQARGGRYKYDIKVKVRGGRNLKADPEIVVSPGEDDLE